MSKIGQAFLAKLEDDQGEDLYPGLLLPSQQEAQEAARLWDLSKYSTNELHDELDRREAVVVAKLIEQSLKGEK